MNLILFHYSCLWFVFYLFIIGIMEFLWLFLFSNKRIFFSCILVFFFFFLSLIFGFLVCLLYCMWLMASVNKFKKNMEACMLLNIYFEQVSFQFMLQKVVSETFKTLSIGAATLAWCHSKHSYFLIQSKYLMFKLKLLSW